MVFSNNLLAGAGGQATGGYTIDQSIRFNSADSAYLEKTYASSESTLTAWSFSAWVKRSKLGAEQFIFQAGTTSANLEYLRFTSSDEIEYKLILSSSVDANYITSQLFRDPGAWMHIYVYRSSTTFKLYINGSEVTDFDTSNAPGSSDGMLGKNVRHRIAADFGSTPANFFGGYLAEMNFVPGTAKAVTDFGETNSTTGQWVPIEYTGSYGTNGFYLKGQDSSALGDDSSGNNNDFTSSGLAAADQVTDSPTNNTATLNPLNPVSSCTFSDGNLQFAETGGSNSQHAKSTIGFTSGEKKVAEMQIVSGSSITFGICDEAFDTSSNSFTGDSRGYFDTNGNKVDSAGNSSAYGASFSSSNVIRIEVDLSSNPGTIEFFKDGVSQGDAFTDIDSTKTWFFWCRCKSDTIKANFGQLGFAGTPTTGFTAPTVANLDDPTIADPSAHFQTTLYSGDSSTQEINQSGNSTFTPGWVWIKARNGAGYSHQLFDQVRGATKRINSDAASSETTTSDTLTSFDSDGFSLGSQLTVNQTGKNYVGWQWAANGSGSSNTDGDITSTVSANTTSGFSVLTYSGNGSDNQTIGHGLGIAPKMIITKRRDSSGNWTTYHDAVGINKVFYLNSTALPASNTEQYRATPTSSLYTVGVGGDINNGSGTYVAMVFAEVEGFSSIGSYTGNGSTNGTFVFTGFKPAWVMLKRITGSTQEWQLYDSERDPFNVANHKLEPNSPSVESILTSDNNLDFLSNGFKLRQGNGGMNASGSDYLYMAFAESPLKTATAR
jgi:hypothetical protein